MSNEPGAHVIADTGINRIVYQVVHLKGIGLQIVELIPIKEGRHVLVTIVDRNPLGQQVTVAVMFTDDLVRPFG